MLSDRSCKTMTFLLALTYGYPRLNFLWAQDSARKGQLLPLENYALSVGYSEVRAREVEHFEARPQTDLLRGKRVVLASASEEFRDDWRQLLVRLGATVEAAAARAAGPRQGRVSRRRIARAQVRSREKPGRLARLLEMKKHFRLPLI